MTKSQEDIKTSDNKDRLRKGSKDNVKAPQKRWYLMRQIGEEILGNRTVC